jgi:hypothetical protein
LRSDNGTSHGCRRGRNETAEGARAVDGRSDAVPFAIVVAGSRDDIGPMLAEHPRLKARNLGVKVIVHRREIDADVRIGDARKGDGHDELPWITAFRETGALRAAGRSALSALTAIRPLQTLLDGVDLLSAS